MRQQQRRNRYGLVLAAGATAAAMVAGLIAASSARAAVPGTYTWNGTSGNISNPAHWVEGVAPTGSNAGDTIRLTGASQFTATNDYRVDQIGAFYVGNIVLDAAAGAAGSKVEAVDPDFNFLNFPQKMQLRAVTQNATIRQVGAGSFILGEPLGVAAGAKLNIDVAPGAGQLIIANPQTQATLAAYVAYDAGDLSISNRSATPVLLGNIGGLRGNLYVTAGSVVAADSTAVTINGVTGNASGDTSRNQTLVVVSAGASFDYNGNAETMGGISGAGTIRMGPTGGLGMNYNKDMVFDGSVIQAELPEGVTLGAGALTKDINSGTTTYTFRGASSFATKSTNGRQLNVNAGTFVLSGNGQFANTRLVQLNHGSTTLVLDNSAGNVVNRINPTSLLTTAGQVRLIGAPGAVSSQTFGAWSVGNGLSGMDVVNGANGGTATVTVATIARGGRGSFVNITGDGTVSVATPPTLANGIIGGYVARGNDWATMDGNNIVPLAAYQTGADPAAWAATDNVKITGPLTGNAAAAAAQSVNSLNFASNQTLTIGSGQKLTVTSGGILSSAGGTITGGQIVGGQASNQEVVANVRAGSTLTINSAIVNSPGNAVLKVGPGTLVLGGTNTYSNQTRVYEGVLEISSDANLGATPVESGTPAGTPPAINQTTPADTTTTVSNPVTISGNGILRVTANTTITHNIVFNGIGGGIDTGPNTVTLLPAVPRTHTRTVANPNGPFVENKNPAISNTTGGFTKYGTGTLVLSGDNGLIAADGPIRIAQGMVQTGQGDVVGGAPLITIDAGAVLDISMDVDGESMSLIQGAGDLRILTRNVNTQAPAGVSFTNGDYLDVEFSGRIMPYYQGVPDAGGNMTKNGEGNLTLSGPSEYSGATTITRGTVTVKGNVIPGTPGPLGTAAGAILIGNTDEAQPYGAGLLIGSANSEVRRDITVFGTFAGQPGANLIGSTHTSGTSVYSGNIQLGRQIEVTVAAGGKTDFTGVLTDAAGGITKVGGGVANLTNGGNSYGGGTRVVAGTLLVNNTSGSATGSGPVYVGGGATLGGNGSIGGATTIGNGGILSPGNSAGTITLAGGLTLADGAVLKMELGTGANNADKILVTGGTLTGSGDAGVTVVGTNTTGLAPGQTYTLIDFTGAGTSGLEADDFEYKGKLMGGKFSIVGSTLQLTTLKLGDLNGDALINSADLNALVNGFNNNLTRWRNGDLNGDGRVSSDDFALFNLGVATNGIPASDIVPEPAAVSGLALAALAGLSRRVRRGR